MSQTSIAVIGPSGTLGKPILDALNSDLVADKVEYPIKVLSRRDKTSTDKFKYFKVEWNESHISSISDILKGTDVIIELISPNPDINRLIEDVLKQVKPKLFIPSHFGVEVASVQKYAPQFLTAKSDHSAAVRSLGIKVVEISTSLFAVPGSYLYEIVGAVGIDSGGKKVTYRGSPNSKISISKLEDVGNASAIIALSDPKSVPDLIRIQSEIITYKDVVSRYEKDHNIILEDAGTISQEQTLKEFQEKLALGFNGNDFLFYLNAIISQGVDNGALFSHTDDELVNPGEKLWKWGKF